MENHPSFLGTLSALRHSSADYSKWIMIPVESVARFFITPFFCSSVISELLAVGYLWSWENCATTATSTSQHHFVLDIIDLVTEKQSPFVFHQSLSVPTPWKVGHMVDLRMAGAPPLGSPVVP